MIRAVFFDPGDTLVIEEDIENKHLWEVKLDKAPCVDRVLQELKIRYKLGIITNTVTSREKHVRSALRKIRIERYFDAIVTSVDVGYEKPDTRIFLAALIKLGVAASEAVMVGNRISKDILGANRLAMKSVLYKWNDRYADTITSDLDKPDYTINSLTELPPLLSKI